MITLSDTLLSEVNGGGKLCDFIAGGIAVSVFFIGSGVGIAVFAAFSIGSTACYFWG